MPIRTWSCNDSNLFLADNRHFGSGMTDVALLISSSEAHELFWKRENRKMKKV
jgi:hypothetical protein